MKASTSTKNHWTIKGRAGSTVTGNKDLFVDEGLKGPGMHVTLPSKRPKPTAQQQKYKAVFLLCKYQHGHNVELGNGLNTVVRCLVHCSMPQYTRNDPHIPGICNQCKIGQILFHLIGNLAAAYSFIRLTHKYIQDILPQVLYGINQLKRKTFVQGSVPLCLEANLLPSLLKELR